MKLLLRIALALVVLRAAVSAFVVAPPKGPAAATTQLFSTASAAPDGTILSISDSLRSVLQKPSKTLAVILDVDLATNTNNDDGKSFAGPSDDIANRSMQLRKLSASAIATSCLATARAIAQEQETAAGNFPGPCPVIYTGTADMEDAAATMGVSAVLVSSDHEISRRAVDTISTICRVASPDDVEKCNAGAYLVDVAACDLLEETLAVIPEGSVVVAAIDSMQDKNRELLQARELKALGVTAILMKKAVTGDGEDVEYASFVVRV